MACNCVEEVNAKLVSRNTRLTTAIVFAERGDNPNLMLQTEQIETGRGKPKAQAMFLSFCPFCGVQYNEPKNGPVTGDRLRGILGIEPEDPLTTDADGTIQTCAGYWEKNAESGMWTFIEDEDDE